MVAWLMHILKHAGKRTNRNDSRHYMLIFLDKQQLDHPSRRLNDLSTGKFVKHAHTDTHTHVVSIR